MNLDGEMVGVDVHRFDEALDRDFRIDALGPGLGSEVRSAPDISSNQRLRHMQRVRNHIERMRRVLNRNARRWEAQKVIGKDRRDHGAAIGCRNDKRLCGTALQAVRN